MTKVVATQKVCATCAHFSRCT